MSNGVNTVAVTHVIKSSMAATALARKPAHEVQDALTTIIAAVANMRSWNSETTSIPALLRVCAVGERRTYAVALRVAYFEFCETPHQSARAPQMTEAIEQWERRIWREPSHVRLGLERCAVALRAELTRRGHP